MLMPVKQNCFTHPRNSFDCLAVWRGSFCSHISPPFRINVGFLLKGIFSIVAHFQHVQYCCIVFIV
jgi:hypothetical protein